MHFFFINRKTHSFALWPQGRINIKFRTYIHAHTYSWACLSDSHMWTYEDVSHSPKKPNNNPQSNISLLHGHHGQLARHFSSFYLLNQSPHLLFMCYRPRYELFNSRGKFTAPVFLHAGCKSTDERNGEREKVVRRVRRRRAGGKWAPEGRRLTQATS